MIITQTPLRISFAGGGTDLAAYYAEREGFVVSTAIDKFVYVIVKERFDDQIYLIIGEAATTRSRICIYTQIVDMLVRSRQHEGPQRRSAPRDCGDYRAGARWRSAG